MTIVHLVKRPARSFVGGKDGGGVCVRFNCPNCNALYELIKAEAGPETVDRAPEPAKFRVGAHLKERVAKAAR
jgi:hypothetical protein